MQYFKGFFHFSYVLGVLVGDQTGGILIIMAPMELGMASNEPT